MRTCFRSLLFCNGNNAVFLTRSRFQIEAPEGFSARLTDPALTNPGFADRSTGLLVSIIAFSEIYYTHFGPALQAGKKFRVWNKFSGKIRLLLASGQFVKTFEFNASIRRTN